jgi:hypothetical protein
LCAISIRHAPKNIEGKGLNALYESAYFLRLMPQAPSVKDTKNPSAKEKLNPDH